MDKSKDCCEFLKRVTAYPVVNRFWLYTVDTYGKVKAYNGLIEYTLTVAESAVLEAAGLAKPVLAKLEVQINAVDGFACSTLDRVELAVPFVKRTPEEITSEVRQMYRLIIAQPAVLCYREVRDYGLVKVTLVAEYGVQKIDRLRNTQYGCMLAAAADQILLKADALVEEYIPPLKLAGQPDEPKMSDDGYPFDKALVLSRKLGQRIYYRGVNGLHETVRKTDEILAALHDALEQVRQMESGFLEGTRKALQIRLALIKAEVDALWENVTYRNAVSYTSSSFTKNVRYIRVFSWHMNYYIHEIYVLSFNAVPTALMARYHAALDALKEFGTWYYENAMTTPPVLWLLQLQAELSPRAVVFANSDHTD